MRSFGPQISDFGKRLYEVTKDDMKVNDDVRRAATTLVGDAATPEEKLKRIYEFCQTKIKNISRDASLTTEERNKLAKEIKSPADTLKRSMGRGSNIDRLFAALSSAAGFEAYIAFSGNRQSFFLDQKFPNPYFLLRGSSFVGVRLGETWRFFSPAETYTPFGMLGWREEGQKALIADKDPDWVQTPLSGPINRCKNPPASFACSRMARSTATCASNTPANSPLTRKIITKTIHPCSAKKHCATTSRNG